MLLDFIINKDSISIPIADPFRADLDAVLGQINGFASSKGTDLSGLDIRGLIPRMIKGIAGCENGCPSNAKELVSRGVKNFELKYIEGGILSAQATAGAENQIFLKMFPDF
ncbi:MAG: hypothetical protein C0402_06180 [Thermodesulfovibrio sp.]|nr:hypothetical protein [Thermodesulfovibrio sp.]